MPPRPPHPDGISGPGYCHSVAPRNNSPRVQAGIPLPSDHAQLWALEPLLRGGSDGIEAPRPGCSSHILSGLLLHRQGTGSFDLTSKSPGPSSDISFLKSSDDQEREQPVTVPPFGVTLSNHPNQRSTPSPSLFLPSLFDNFPLIRSTSPSEAQLYTQDLCLVSVRTVHTARAQSLFAE